MRNAGFTAFVAAFACGALFLGACGETEDHPIVSNGGSAGFAGDGGSAGTASSGGSASGGSASGGSANGGNTNGGNGGWPSGGTSSGGAGTGGSATGGSATGGAATGGAAGSGAAGAAGSGGSGGKPPIIWKLHQFSFSTNTWQTFPLDQVWTGAGAPPPRDIAATTNLDVFSTPMLIVFTTSGQYYLRRGSAWSHASIGSKFTRNSATVEAAYSVPWNDKSNTTPPQENVYVSSFPNVGIYTVDSNLNVVASSVETMVDEASIQGPPQGSVPAKFWTVVADADDYVMSGVWLLLYEMLSNGNLYETDNSFAWTRHSPASSFSIFQVAGAPNPNALTAAYYEVSGNVVNFVGP
ncbi:MAG: hypothetical protein R3B89_06620 [Polyangiaceae bacterium]